MGDYGKALDALNEAGNPRDRAVRLMDVAAVLSLSVEPEFAVAELAAEALFASDVQPSEDPDPNTVDAAIVATLTRLGSEGCAEAAAQAFGDHPDLAAGRMRWCRLVLKIPACAAVPR